MKHPGGWNNRISRNEQGSNDDSLDSENKDKIVGSYEEKSKDFIRIFSLLLGLTIFFLFMIFLPYVFILKNFDQTNSDLSEVQTVHDDLQAIQNDINNLQSNQQSDSLQIKHFFTNIIGKLLQLSKSMRERECRIP